MCGLAPGDERPPTVDVLGEEVGALTSGLRYSVSGFGAAAAVAAATPPATELATSEERVFDVSLLLFELIFSTVGVSIAMLDASALSATFFTARLAIILSKSKHSFRRSLPPTIEGMTATVDVGTGVA